MTWSEQVGVSIMLPADRVQGDGRNYIVVGEDVPAEIASDFTAAIVFHNGVFDPATVGNLYPTGFVYHALGISRAGSLELVTYYFVVPAPGVNSYTGYRHTVWSLSPPVNSGNPPVLSLGYNPNYGTYNEGALSVVSTRLGEIVPKTYFASPYPNPTVFAPWGAAGWDDPHYWLDAAGTVHLSGQVRCVGAGNWGTATTIVQLPAGVRPGFAKVFPVASLQSTVMAMLLQIQPNGIITWAQSLTPNGGFTYTANGYIALDGISFRAEG